MREVEKMKDTSRLLLGIVILISIVAVMLIAEVKHDEKAWNNGYCSICGSEWEYQDMYHVRNSGNYYIYCDKQGHSIEIGQNYGK